MITKETLESWYEEKPKSKVCTICGGSGEIIFDERDSDGNWVPGVQIAKCICRIIEKDDYDDRIEKL